MGADGPGTTFPAVVEIGLEDRASVIGPGTALARVVGFPAGHLVWCIWRSAIRETEFFDASCTVIRGKF